LYRVRSIAFPVLASFFLADTFPLLRVLFPLWCLRRLSGPGFIPRAPSLVQPQFPKIEILDGLLYLLRHFSFSFGFFLCLRSPRTVFDGGEYASSACLVQLCVLLSPSFRLLVYTDNMRVPRPITAFFFQYLLPPPPM